MIRSRTAFSLDVTLITATFLLVLIGILFIYSSGLTLGRTQTSNEYVRQIVWAVLGVVLMFGASVVKLDWARTLAPWVYFFFLLLLLLTLFFGKVVNGAKSWLGVGELGIQPSEFTKIALILVLARYLEDNPNSVQSLGGFLKPLLFFLLPSMGMVLLQPDLGTSTVYFPIVLMMLLFAGAQKRYLFFLFMLAGLAVIFACIPIWESNFLRRDIPLLAIFNETRMILIFSILLGILLLLSSLGYFAYKRKAFYWVMYSLIIFVLAYGSSFLIRGFLKDYQIMRLIVFLDPSVDRLGSGWHIIQSTIAVGSGGLLGKGYLSGTQSQLQYLPEQSTDFIFSILSEEWGFLGAMTVFLLYGLLIFRCFRISYQARDAFGRYIGVGVGTLFFFHFIVNVGMTIGLMPIIGIPLLLVSYGGSNLWMSMLGLGLIVNIGLNRYRY